MSNTTDNEETTGTAHHVGSAADLEVGDHLLVEINGIEIAVFNTENGYFAMSNYCVHQGGPLCEGPVTGTLSEGPDRELSYDSNNKVVRCPWHNWEFDIESGEHLSRPDYSQPTYEVNIEDGELFVTW